MNAFLNELSVHGQFEDNRAVCDSIRRVSGILARLTQVIEQPLLYYDRQLYHAQATSDRILSSCLKNMGDRSVVLQFKILVHERLAGRLWESERQHADCTYEWNGRNVTGTSVAELAERRLRAGTGLLVNFSPSIFDGRTIRVEKEANGTIELELVGSEARLNEWCDANPRESYATFDPASGRPPRDRETILRDTGRFARTSLLNQGRVVYLDRRTSCYYCVDNMHVGGAHLEVFDADGRHIGEASLGGALDQSKADTGKRLAM